MNIKDYWDTLGPPPPFSLESLETLLLVREETMQGFIAIEASRGSFMQYPMYLEDHLTQDALRLLFFRALEEMQEAEGAESREHEAEEYIDAINFLLEAALLDSKVSRKTLALLWGGLLGPARVVPQRLLGHRVVTELTQAAELFRNRSWMNNAQDVYFGHSSRLFSHLMFAVACIQATFPTWELFWRYFMAKDKVLRFRLESRY